MSFDFRRSRLDRSLPLYGIGNSTFTIMAFRLQFRQIQPDREGRSLGRSFRKFNSPVILFDDVTAHKQAQSRPRLFRREVGRKDAISVFSRDSLSIIPDINPQQVVDNCCLDFDRAPFFCSVHRIQDQIQENLDQLVTNKHQQREVVDVLRQNGLSLFSLVVLGDIQGDIKDGMQIAA